MRRYWRLQLHPLQVESDAAETKDASATASAPEAASASEADDKKSSNEEETKVIVLIY